MTAGNAGPDHEPDEEHERRFLVSDLSILNGSSYERIEQGYLWSGGGYAVRARRVWRLEGDREVEKEPAFWTLKGPREGSVRYERDEHLPPHRAADLISLAPHRIDKRRHGVMSEGNAWVVDVFQGENEGLVIAEFEGSPEAVRKLKKPWWCDEEITQDKRYNNENLAKDPWSTWQRE